ncbi:MAG: sugar ABC transporter substrate-binding protein, partial [Planctomycetes bacterium]|nr:sugar ABC transporter substrate-binding protein [Planctomycetota bacterium]
MRKLLATIATVCLLSACDGGGSDGNGAERNAVAKPKLAFVTNGVASFWVIAEKGARDAGEATGADVEVLMPAGGVVDQKRMLE